MLDTINIGTSGLLGHAKGLRIVGNNLANVNTPGFKSSQLAFTDLFNQGGTGGTLERDGKSGSTGMGNGLVTLGSHINFKAGLDSATGRPLDLNINGNGFFAVEREGKIYYTRAGDFSFDDKGVLVNAAGEHVKGLEDGKLVDVTLDGLDRALPKGTTTVDVAGVLTTSNPTVKSKLDGVIVYDTTGTNQPLNLTFTNNANGDYTVTVADKAGKVLTEQHIKYLGGAPVAGADSVSFNYAPEGATPFDVKLSFAKTSSTADPTSLRATNDGYAIGLKTDESISADGLVTVQYSNGQKATGKRVALANFDSVENLEQVGGSAFEAKQGVHATYGYAGAEGFGTLVSGHREGSNVDLAEEFGNLILMQRGYQASSHVISTANDMIQQLFDMKRR